MAFHSLSRLFLPFLFLLALFSSLCLQHLSFVEGAPRRFDPRNRPVPQEGEEKNEERQHSGRFNAELGMASMQKAFKDPAVLKEAMEMYNDPEVMAEVQRMMKDPEFQRQIEKYTQSPLFKQSIEKAKEIAQDPKKLKALQEEMSSLLQDPAMKEMLPPGFEMMDGMLDDVDFQKQLQDLLKDPSALMGAGAPQGSGQAQAGRKFQRNPNQGFRREM